MICGDCKEELLSTQLYRHQDGFLCVSCLFKANLATAKSMTDEELVDWLYRSQLEHQDMIRTKPPHERHVPPELAELRKAMVAEGRLRNLWDRISTMLEEEYNRTAFSDCEVPADSVEDFLNRYYRPERRTDTLLASYEADFARRGFTIISAHDNVTGKVVCYRPRPKN